MDIASIVGLIVCFIMIIVGILTSSSDGIAAIGNYIDIPSIAVTLGGSFCCVLSSMQISEFVAGLKSFSLVLKVPKYDTIGTIQKIIELSNVARKEGLLSLEEAAGNLEDNFMKKGIMLIVDGTDPELVRAIMETEITSMDDRHRGNVGFWENVATMGPAWGMIGTLLGLVNMLQNMSDPTSIGPSMAVALITTLYGSILANWIATPVATKLKANNNKEISLKEIMVEGLLSIQAGENPRVIEEKLKSFLTPKDRTSGEADGGEANG